MITIHLANAVERRRADALVRRIYALQKLGDHGLPPYADTFIVCDGRHMVGTLSLVVDEDGLPADDLFKAELDGLRSAGARLCELTRFVLESQAPSAQVFSDLFAAIHRHGVHHYDCSDLVIQADPRHCLFYRRRLGFKQLGEPAMHPGYEAPAQLMRIHVNHLTRHFAAAHADDGAAAATEGSRPFLRAA